jgi:hypothetical protein
MPPTPTWYSGREDVAAFLAERPLKPGRRWRLVPVRANGQLAFGEYLWDEQREAFVGHSINVLTLAGTEIAEMTAFLDQKLISLFGLPAEIAG